MNRQEILLDAIAQVKGASDPSSAAYKLRNLLMIRSFAKEGTHDVDENGVRRFKSWSDSYKSCGFDLSKKLSGETRATVIVNKARRRLSADDNLEQLLHVFDVHGSDTFAVVGFLQVALDDSSVSLDTPMAYFRKEAE
jgi:hypothetical protein